MSSSFSHHTVYLIVREISFTLTSKSREAQKEKTNQQKDKFVSLIDGMTNYCLDSLCFDFR